jgi:hypothetical protein
MSILLEFFVVAHDCQNLPLCGHCRCIFKLRHMSAQERAFAIASKHTATDTVAGLTEEGEGCASDSLATVELSL